ncbi:MAG: 2-amino-4-hydroxy-6-hydroxymethyldihydropteridine diphosphokinase [Candidatus Margulisiibacteriota bacterium]|nr:MAG: 2-amino-4-hydroxy-6-hydroxymethyldihydropteridine diphosphokinase [Candidatus Margulisbacteria bacterium GWD2_39_127]OGI02858.1 MAG: 2-amino-4-hydroxy-6-hydroxymethyldihydropteridine diphosphokinase [Candidatus Margulisbacteria bacterium GWF2_38_17]OGI09639.1 MAG: 2-amino-4-hydroxy-6-hydroxymethyldihydropteridine diphosphokinase [Candidatus Margulisbacteria bacterium GWE2_39_32]PZM83035.1 MAG: 2-amino-4-hydroxy-6-hydroxymethyldihydropteridine diphosphokinase [Candidatus Margulisiibacteri
MTRAFVSIGSNISPGKNVKSAIGMLSAKEHVVKISTVYRTEPEGHKNQPAYYNCVIEINTEKPPLQLKNSVLKPIEKSLGRERSADKYASRTIDLDLIIYDSLVLVTDKMTLPDPMIVCRSFLAIPLMELSPDLVLPGWNVPIDKVAGKLSQANMEPLKEYTEQVRKEISHA